jgi:hypothetical protein
VTSHRRRKQQARAQGLVPAELQLCELLREVLDLLRWNQVLGYSNQYLLHQKLAVSEAERQRVLQAAATAVEQDARHQDWQRRLGEVQQALQRIERQLGRGGEGAGAAAERADG